VVGSNCKEGGVWAGRVGTMMGDKTQGVGFVFGVETVLVAEGIVGSVV
jgi:histidyl-tRNA synthetase